MTLDGAPYGDYGQKTHVQVKTVHQTLRLEHTADLCEPLDVDIRPNDTRSKIDAHLRCKGFVKVLCNTPRAEVRIGTAKGRCNEEIHVLLPRQKDRATMVVRVGAPQHKPVEDKVTVEALKLVEISVALVRVGE